MRKITISKPDANAVLNLYSSVDCVYFVVDVYESGQSIERISTFDCFKNIADGPEMEKQNYWSLKRYIEKYSDRMRRLKVDWEFGFGAAINVSVYLD